MSFILFKLNGTPSLIIQYSIMYIFFLDFKCLAILGPSLEILYLFCILFNASIWLYLIFKYLGSPIL